MFGNFICNNTYLVIQYFPTCCHHKTLKSLCNFHVEMDNLWNFCKMAGFEML